MTPLSSWLQLFDNFNKLAPGLVILIYFLEILNCELFPASEREDTDDLLWPGSQKYLYKSSFDQNQEILKIRKFDFENHNKEGGSWMVFKVRAYYFRKTI